MRTDPHPAQVRAIVERVFQGYLQANAGPVLHARQPSFPRLCECPEAHAPGSPRPEAHRVPARGCGSHPEAYASGSPAFPRLYEPNRERCGARRKLADGTRSVPATFADGTRSVPATLLEIDETILIDDGRYVARSYRSEGYMAMWLVAVGIVQFYDAEGQMLTTVNLFETLRPVRMAA